MFTNRKPNANFFLVVTVSFMTALFIFLLESLAMRATSNKSADLDLVKALDTENILGYLVPGQPVQSEKSYQLDNMLTDEQMEIFHEDGLVRADDFTSADNGLYFGIDKLFVDIKGGNTEDIMSSNSDRQAGTKIVRYESQGTVPSSIKLCGSTLKEKSCEIPIKNDSTGQIMNLQASLQGKKTSHELMIQIPQAEGEAGQDKTEFVGSGKITLDIESSR